MNAVQCDYCGKFAANPQGGKYMMGQRLPKGWWLAVAEQLDLPLASASKFFAKPRGDE